MFATYQSARPLLFTAEGRRAVASIPMDGAARRRVAWQLGWRCVNAPRTPSRRIVFACLRRLGEWRHLRSHTGLLHDIIKLGRNHLLCG